MQPGGGDNLGRNGILSDQPDIIDVIKMHRNRKYKDYVYGRC